jgi:hypothetical protein
MTDKRAKRRKQTAEVFTPAELVNEMLDKLNEYGPESWEPGKTFLDPACGNGNMLVEILKRKISLGHSPSKALASIYGTDIMADNIEECKNRLLVIIGPSKRRRRIVDQNIVCTPLDQYPNGSLDYDFSFGQPSTLFLDD